MGSKVQEYAGQLAQRVPWANPDVQEPAQVATVPVFPGLVAFKFDCRRALGWPDTGLGGHVFQ
jgi:hypothetical protein